MIRNFCFISLITAASVICCTDNHPNRHRRDVVSFDLDSIKARGKLIALTDFNSTNYFIYRGEPMGFHYELLKSFSEHLGIDFEIVTENHLDDAFSMLHSGKADLLAMGLTVTATRKKRIKFTEPIAETREVLVQMKPQGWRNMPADSVEKSLIRDRTGLTNKTVYVQESSSHAASLHSLSRETGKPVMIIEVPIESETLIQLVGRGEIDYTVADENVALVNATYYPDIDAGTPVSLPRSLAWGVRKTHSAELLRELNQWITTFRKTRTYALLYAKYFKNSRSDKMVKSDYYALTTGRISRWDEIIKVYSDSIRWDWRLLASLICQESRFDPSVTSWAGAYGLMQIMPETGKRFGIDIKSSPRKNIEAGTRYIKWLHSIFDPKIEDQNERTRFILAAYNAGPGHVLDAMKLAEKNGMDPQKWHHNVEEWLLKKSEPRYYNDTVAKNGYFRGNESVAFVNEVLDRFHQYKNIIP